ncbi:hypothetical protein ACF7ID_13890, partial [Staphylococcus aureus]
ITLPAQADQVIITPPVVAANARHHLARHAFRHPAAQVWGVTTMNFLLPAPQRIIGTTGRETVDFTGFTCAACWLCTFPCT